MTSTSRTWSRLLGAGLLVALGWATHALYPEWFTANDTGPTATTASSNAANAAQVERGAYLAKLGNCAHCHTARDGAPYAGGRGIDTPFGTVFSSNLTPDALYGIGQWTAQDFWNAMHAGRTPDGRVFNPAFPYTSFTRIARDDSDALYAYLRTLPASASVRPPHNLTWPLGTQVALRAWRAMYFNQAPTREQAPLANGAQDALQERGAYLVQGLGHCQECHAQRNALGGVTTTGAMHGGLLPQTPWWAPALSELAPTHKNTTVTTTALSDLLRTGRTPTPIERSVGGPMAEVVTRSTQYLSDTDALAMATYLRSIARPPSNATPLATATRPEANPRGAELYEKHCEACHGKQGEGFAGAYPALAGNPAVSRNPFNNLALKIMRGGFAPATTGNPRPYGMPPYLLTLSEADTALVLSYIRNSWGNTGEPVSEFDINRLKASIHP